MRVTTVFNKLLNLQGAFVRAVRFTVDAVVVTVAPRARRHRCPRCRFGTHAGYDKHVATWRHVALGRWRVVVEAMVFRLECPTHGVLTERVAWAYPFTGRIELDTCGGRISMVRSTSRTHTSASSSRSARTPS